METIEELVAFLEEACQDDARAHIIDRGDASSMMRHAGVPEDDSPAFSETLDQDLAEYGFAVLDAALALKELDRRHPLCQLGFRTAGRAFEVLVRNGDPERTDRGFHRIVSATSYHLAGYAAMAFALLRPFRDVALNLNIAETAIEHLILRDLEALRRQTRTWLTDDNNRDATLALSLRSEDADPDEIYGRLLNSVVCRSLAYFDLALLSGDATLIETARSILDAGQSAANLTGNVTLWWIIRITRWLLDDLWDASLHQVLPLQPAGEVAISYTRNREIFIGSMVWRDTSQIDLWPSQVEAARRAADPKDNLVVAMQTSAGKTRIAELCALTTLSLNKRVLIVTPLRALSAQTERSFREVFAPLGMTVSSLYGKSGLSAGDASALRDDRIVVTTPEKLDFALRSTPDVIDDVGLIVLDEGHMIGPSDRELRFEILVQRLLRREDANARRIVCLSAILPEGEMLEDMTSWLRSDDPGEACRSEWRPTRQRFGTLEWRGSYGRLKYDLDDEGPFLSRFLEELPAIHPERNPYPRDIKDISLMAAWRFADQGKRTLIFIPTARWVEGYASRAIHLIERGYLPSLLDDQEAVADAIRIGSEWLGPDHPAVACLRYGIAVHQGKLPSPFLREVERLLSTGTIRVTAASPTLAQGLNLNAAVLLAPYLRRNGDLLTGEEFANIAGRAGRAFVDVEGLILHVIKDRHVRRRNEWRNLRDAVRARQLKSGLRLIINAIIRRLADAGVNRNSAAYEYLANAREPWLREPDGEIEGEPLSVLVEKLDTIVLGLIESFEMDAEDLPEKLDEVLSGSLWAHQMARLDPGVRRMHRIVLNARARLIWSQSTPAQRRGFFAMGVGLESGLVIEELADDLIVILNRADDGALTGDIDVLHENLVSLAERLLAIRPFAPDTDFPANWRETLRRWLSGQVAELFTDEDIKLIEDAFVYRLVWAIEALRTRRIALGWVPDPFEGEFPGLAAACLDTGLPNFRMAILVRSGLSSRQAAKTVVDETDPDYMDGASLREWLRRPEISEKENHEDWPTEQTHALWLRFVQEALTDRGSVWEKEVFTADSIEITEKGAHFQGTTRLDASVDGDVFFLSPDFDVLGKLTARPFAGQEGILFSRFDGPTKTAEITRIGPRII